MSKLLAYKTQRQLLIENEQLRPRLEEAEEMLRAIRNGEVDALVVSGEQGNHVFSLKSADYAYRMLIEQMNEGAMSLSANGVILYCNHRLADMLKTPLEQVLGSRFNDLLSPADQALFDVLLQEGSPATRQVETACRAPDGSMTPVLLSLFALPMDNIGRLCAVVTDLTGRKRTDEALRQAHEELETRVVERTRALRENEQKFRAIYEGSNDAIMLLDENGFFDCNPRTLEMFGFKSKKEFTRVHPGDISPPTQPNGQPSFPAAQEHIEAAYRQGYHRFEWVYRRTSGECFSAEVVLSAFNYAGTRVLQATVRDITERKRAEEALSASEIQYRRLFEAAKDGILILDADTGAVVDVNPFLVELLGFAREQLLGKRVWELGLFKDVGASQSNFEELQRSTYVRYEDLPLEAANGRRVDVEFVSNVYLVSNRKVIQFNIRDITERKREEEERRRLDMAVNDT